MGISQASCPKAAEQGYPNTPPCHHLLLGLWSAPGTATHALGMSSQEGSARGCPGALVCLPFSLRRKLYRSIALPCSGPVSCSILPGLPCFFLLPSPCPTAVRPCLHFCLLPSFLSLHPPRARSLLHPPREATSRAKVSCCQVAACPAWGSGSAGPPCRPPPGSLLSAASPGEPAVCCSRSGEGCSPTSESSFPLGGPPAHPFCCGPGAGQTPLCLVPPFPESLRVCWLPAPARRILFLPLR